MVSCKNCATPNSLDSTFCKKCGTTIPEEDLKLASEKLEAVIAQGVALYNGGKHAEAMAVAETAVASNPSSIAALALKGDCHASRGEISEAIECYESIVALNPDSTLDKIRLNQLRNSLVLTARSTPDRRIAAIGAAAAVVLVVCVTALFARSRALQPEPNEIVASAQEKESPADRAQFYDAANPPKGEPEPNEQTPANPSAQTAPPTTNVPDSTPTRQRQGTGLPTPPTRVLPRPSEDGGVEYDIRPVQPNLPNGPIGGSGNGNSGNGGSVAKPPKTTLDEDPSVDRSTTIVPEPRVEDPGTIEIEVRKGGSQGAGTTSTRGSATGVEALVRVARDQYQLGNYSGAANAYEKALNSGGDPVSINQRLGQAYDRLGRKGDAASAFQKALSAAESAIASGKGDRNRLQAVADSCRQALRVLGN